MGRENWHFEELCYCSPGRVSGPCYYVRTGKYLKEDEDDISLVTAMFRNAFDKTPATGGKETKP